MNVAYAEIVVVVSSQSSIVELNKQQVSDLFLGKISTFPNGKMAVPLEQQETSNEHKEFHEKVTGKSAAQLKAYWSKSVFSGKGSPPQEVEGGAVKRMIAKNINLIGYINQDLVDGTLKIVLVP